jgi:hypothetical protein
MIKLKDLIEEGIKEGLSFSDYYDESVPYDVKPVPCIRPMEENIPIEAHTKWPHTEGATKTFQQIRDQEDPDGTKHDLSLECVKCGNKHTCKCSKPKRKIYGICPDCEEKQQTLIVRRKL